MSERIHALAQRLFGKATLDECNLEEVKSLAQRFPYFAPAQFLLLEKLKQEGSDAYAAQLQKSILYYHNPLEFQYFISSDRFYTEVSFEETEEAPERGEQNGSDETGRINGEEPAGEKEPGEMENINAETQLINTEPEIGETQILDGEDREPLNEQPLAVSGPSETATEEQAPPAIAHAAAPPPAAEEPSPSVPDSGLPTPTSRLPTPGSETPLAFEPYHTVDYFASQGIRLSQEEIPKDKFGRQLKSFTDWLKTMKRLPASETTALTDAGSESKVQHLAEDSIHESDVWTESMAEVWIKQGNRQKAIETYNKLVLLNPSKRAYFATKIENLKRS